MTTGAVRAQCRVDYDCEVEVSSGRESVAGEALDRDGGERRVRRIRVRKIQGFGCRARVAGLGSEVQRRRRRCLPPSRLREKGIITIGLERSFLGVPGLRVI